MLVECPVKSKKTIRKELLKFNPGDINFDSLSNGVSRISDIVPVVMDQIRKRYLNAKCRN